jgi:hypothetical protein
MRSLRRGTPGRTCPVCTRQLAAVSPQLAVLEKEVGALLLDKVASGLFSEEYDVAQRQMRGNLPQAFVHALMLEASSRLAARDAAALTHPRAVHSPTRGHTTTTTHRRQPVVAGREQDQR